MTAAAKGKDSTPVAAMPDATGVDPDFVHVDGGTDRAAALAALVASTEPAQPHAEANQPYAIVDYTPSGTEHVWSETDGAPRFLVKARWYARNFTVKNWEGKSVQMRHQANRGDVIAMDSNPDVEAHVAQGYLTPVKE